VGQVGGLVAIATAGEYMGKGKSSAGHDCSFSIIAMAIMFMVGIYLIR